MSTKIMPVTDLRRDTKAIIHSIREGGDVVYITQHGRPAVVAGGVFLGRPAFDGGAGLDHAAGGQRVGGGHGAQPLAAEAGTTDVGQPRASFLNPMPHTTWAARLGVVQ